MKYYCSFYWNYWRKQKIERLLYQIQCFCLQFMWHGLPYITCIPLVSWHINWNGHFLRFVFVYKLGIHSASVCHVFNCRGKSAPNLESPWKYMSFTIYESSITVNNCRQKLLEEKIRVKKFWALLTIDICLIHFRNIYCKSWIWMKGNWIITHRYIPYTK